MGDPVTQWQIVTKQPKEHAEFYAAAFGWVMSSDNPLGYCEADTRSPHAMSGGFWPAPPEARAFVQLFIQVDDIAETIKKVTENGGDIVIPAQDVPNGDQIAILRDPFGITFGVVMPGRK